MTITYSLDYRKQVLKSLDEGMTFAEAAVFYNISPMTIQKWKKRLHSKTTRDIKPYKIENEGLAQDVKDHPDESPRDCRRPNFLREYDNENTTLHS